MSEKGEWLLCDNCEWLLCENGESAIVEFNRVTLQGICNECKKESEVKEVVTKVDRTMHSMSNATELIESKNRVAAEELLLQMLRDIDGLVHSNSIFVCSIKQQISRCHEDRGQWQEAIEWLMQCSESVQKIFGEDSDEMMRHYQKLSDLYTEFTDSLDNSSKVLNAVRSALIFTSKALKMMSQCSHESVDIFNQRLVYLFNLEWSLTKIYSPETSVALPAIE